MPTIRVEGYRETVQALGRVNRGAKRALFTGLRTAAQPVADDAKSRLSKYAGISLATIKPSAQARGVMVIQRAKKVDGKHPNFGALQMTHGLIPALHDNEGKIVDSVEAAFAALTITEGL